MKLQSIQALRGLAALLVLIFHIHELEVLAIADNSLTERAWVGGLFTNGYAGVDLFFVLSGWLIGGHAAVGERRSPSAGSRLNT